MRVAVVALALVMTTGCIEGLTQVAGTGAIYTTRCSSAMDVVGDVYTAQCVPDLCSQSFDEAALNQVVVAIDPGRKIVGYAERVCIQDLAEATVLFQPGAQGEPTTPAPSE